ncbi:hypothetical protein BDY17DRAFT_289375 [Neohortaea acidophila]|uniref:Uncharacterized protein n=1 Tax=Neohortaea acidophila TaxID=245834 RepID=A0A6A6Q5D1_9PEZI|nr:uncharacterized protein BDY17DRAFT_289375 [Neohortaea acidophila]KAF2487658.1 hypothetical protein BDY17DRAFT_289375 [Neohortaea acidophila]
MPMLRTLTALYACLALASSLPSSGSTATCDPHGIFRLEDPSGQYLEPGSGCNDAGGCYAFYNASSTTGFEYTIEHGTSHLMIAKAPKGSKSQVGLYADTGQSVVVYGGIFPFIFSPATPTHLNCTVKPDSSGDGTCDLDCRGTAYGRLFKLQSVDPTMDGQWFLGRKYGEIVSKAVYT